MDRFDFPGWLAATRTHKKLTYRALAALSKISPGHLNNLEKGTAAPTDDVLIAIAAALDVDPDWLLAQVDTTRLDPARIARLRKYAPAFLGLAAEDRASYGDEPGKARPDEGT